MISTSTKGRIPSEDDVKLRRKAVTLAIPSLTSIDTANALATALRSRYSQANTELVDINHMRSERQKISFIKMHGCGNDYIFIDCMNRPINNMESIAVSLSERHNGVGGDGVVFICSSNVADAKMRMFNADGSEGKMCGNAIRCVGKYLYDNGKVSEKNIKIETISGIKELNLFVRAGLVNSATVDMGVASFNAKDIPAITEKTELINEKIQVLDKTFEATCVSIGNAHCVIFVNDVSAIDIEKYGKAIETLPMFPDRINVEFVQVIDPMHLKMRVWERGSGETYACGSGACAAVVAAVKKGVCQKGADISLKLRGGELLVKYDDRVYLTGDAVEVFKGVARL